MLIRKAKISEVREISLLTQDTIRKVNAKDYSPEQIKVWKKTDTEEKVKERMQDKNRFTCIAIENNQIVGVGSLKDDEITAIYVSANYLRKGIGAKILAYLEQKAYKMGVRKLKVDSSLTAMEFYEKHGFGKIKEGFHVNSEGGKLPSIHMEKIL
ncbi:MAG: GNAT family N-acetyltransferase [Patescibacteria group bacterium]|nr:GNAT family N-acetyltransferase [Patescibacteria group bacterium]